MKYFNGFLMPERHVIFEFPLRTHALRILVTNTGLQVIPRMFYSISDRMPIRTSLLRLSPASGGHENPSSLSGE
jgi:hypothetical protein